MQLQNLNREEILPVIRGKRGQMQTVSAWDLVVGDIIQLKPGDKVPADCLVLSSANLAVNEPQPRNVDEEEAAGEPEYDNGIAKDAQNDPFLYADSYISRGICKVLICVVGQNSTRGIKDTKYDTTENVTELSQRLDNIAGSLKFLGLITSIIVLGTSLIVLFIHKGVDDDLTGDKFTKRMITCVIVALILLIVAIPEGLPMTVTVSLAYSVLQMSEDDNLLVRDVDSVERVGQITDLVLGKTGTMTTEEMTVHSFFAQNHKVLNSRPNTFQYCELDEQIQKKIIESIVWNSSAYIEMDDHSFYVPEGQGTEVSLIKWMQNAEEPVHEFMAQKFQDDVVLATVPFSSTLKKSVIAIKHPELYDTVRVYVKGAPEVVLPNCNYTYGEGENPDKMQMSENDRQNISAQLAEMTQLSMRCIALSYADMSIGQFQEVLNNMQGEIDDLNEIASLEGQDQTFLALVALKDPLRTNIKDVIKNANESGINLVVCSGDNLLTSSACASDAGIITKEQFKAISSGDQASIAMDASQFAAQVGDVVETEDPVEEGEEQTYSYSLTNQEEFNRIIENLKVIGRARPEDKQRLIAGLKGMNQNEEDASQWRRVAVIGEGINDVRAFKTADVSFALQSGTSIARNNASMVLRTDDFDSAMKAVMWGRNLFMNVQRFLQFQITCNLAVLITVLVSYITMMESVLNPVQLIYINLIMDILGALALASTRPTTEIAQYRAGQGNIMTPFMYRQIFGCMLGMVGIMMVIMYAGPSIFDAKYKNSDSALKGNKRINFTLIWNTFIFLNVFNLINCRDVSANKMHGFGGLIRNKLTCFVILIIIAVQIVSCFTFLGYPFFKASLVLDESYGDGGRHFAISVVCASSVLLCNAMLKLIPSRWISKMPQLDESKSIGGNTKIMAAYDKQAKSKAFSGKKAGAAEQVPEEDPEGSYQQDQEDPYGNDPYSNNDEGYEKA